MPLKTIAVILIAWLLAASCNNANHSKTQTMNTIDSVHAQNDSAQIKEKQVSFTVNGQNYLGYVAYDDKIQEKRPGILVVPEWWGLNDYTKSRARQLAALGYVAMAIDMYGDGKQGTDPKTAQELATPYYKDPSMAKTHIDAAINELKSLPQTDTSKIAAIGYCFGGFIVLNAAKLGSDLKGVVSFHGGLTGAPPQKGMKTKFLICHGGNDEFENGNVAEFKKQMDSVGANYTFNIYPNATHAFTNPNATETGIKFNMPIKYNPQADAASWNDMKAFLKGIF